MKTKSTKTMRAGVRSGRSAATGSTAARRRVTRRTQSDRQPKPRTAYELCERVAQHIEEEPKRYYQGFWGYSDRGEIRDVIEADPAPCGTLACRAGWIVALHDGMRSARRMFSDYTTAYGTQERANEILGMDDDDTLCLFDGGALLGVRGRPGTKSYAVAGANGLRKWMDANAEHLKSRLLKDVPKLAKG